MKYISRRVEYSYLDVKIPRCESCKRSFQKVIVLHFCTNGTCSRLFWSDNCKGPGGHLIGNNWIIAGGMGKVEKKQKKDQDPPLKKFNFRILKQHPLLREKIESGWTFSKPKPHLL